VAEDSLPAYPFFEVDGPTAVFGCDADKYLSRSEGSRVSRLLPKEAKAFSALFFSGGKLSDHGLQFKHEYREKGYSTLRGLMCSYAPPHESKEGTVALALHHWCEPIEVLA
jgi:hypothetical protein